MVIWTWLQSGVCGKIWWNYIPLVNFEATFWLQDGAEEQMTQSWPMRHPPRRREQMIGFSPILKSMFHGLTMDQHVEAMSRQPKAKNWWFALYVCCHVCHIPLVYHLYFLNIWPFGLPSLTPHIFTLVRMISLKPTYYNYTFHYWLMVMQCWIEPSTGFSYGKHHGLTWFTLILKAEQTDTFFPRPSWATQGDGARLNQDAWQLQIGSWTFHISMFFHKQTRKNTHWSHWTMNRNDHKLGVWGTSVIAAKASRDSRRWVEVLDWHSTTHRKS